MSLSSVLSLGRPREQSPTVSESPAAIIPDVTCVDQIHTWAAVRNIQLTVNMSSVSHKWIVPAQTPEPSSQTRPWTRPDWTYVSRFSRSSQGGIVRQISARRLGPCAFRQTKLRPLSNSQILASGRAPAVGCGPVKFWPHARPLHGLSLTTEQSNQHETR